MDRISDRFVSEEGTSFVLKTDITNVQKNLRALVSMGVTLELSEILKIQEKELNNCKDYRVAWKEATSIFHREKKSKISSHYCEKHGATFPDAYHIALICYTMEEPNFYKKFNRETREFNHCKGTSSYKYSSYFILLYKAIVDMPGYPYETERTLYRGLKLLSNAPEIGSLVAFQQFLSTTSDPNVAISFCRGDVNTLFVIKNKTRNESGLDLHSVLKSEKEVLIWPREAFYVRSVKDGVLNGKKVRLIELEM